MGINLFQWPEYSCKKCKNKNWEVRRCINQGGHETFLYVCESCGERTTHFIRKKLVKSAGIQAKDIEPKRARHKCEVCGSAGAEKHHWAPCALFGNEAEKWPKSYLCTSCHRKWHDVVTPNISQIKKA